ncbi:unnamed protein product [Closterium sp. Naga37s-1]|nr:unnamed protein product [Closterium sp. Naga37s-1]
MSQIPVAVLGDISRDTMVCDSMAVQQQCGQLLDDLVCAATCDPYAGSYVAVNEFVGSTEVAVCLREAEAVFEACKDILFISTSKSATLDLTPYFPDARTFMTQIVGGILRVVMGNDKVQIVLTSANCIAGSTNAYPHACYSVGPSPVATPSLQSPTRPSQQQTQQPASPPAPHYSHSSSLPYLHPTLCALFPIPSFGPTASQATPTSTPRPRPAVTPSLQSPTHAQSPSCSAAY